MSGSTPTTTPSTRPATQASRTPEQIAGDLRAPDIDSRAQLQFRERAKQELTRGGRYTAAEADKAITQAEGDLQELATCLNGPRRDAAGALRVLDRWQSRSGDRSFGAVSGIVPPEEDKAVAARREAAYALFSERFDVDRGQNPARVAQQMRQDLTLWRLGERVAESIDSRIQEGKLQSIVLAVQCPAKNDINAAREIKAVYGNRLFETSDPLPYHAGFRSAIQAKYGRGLFDELERRGFKLTREQAALLMEGLYGPTHQNKKQLPDGREFARLNQPGELQKWADKGAFAACKSGNGAPACADAFLKQLKDGDSAGAIKTMNSWMGERRPIEAGDDFKSWAQLMNDYLRIKTGKTAEQLVAESTAPATTRPATRPASGPAPVASSDPALSGARRGGPARLTID